MARNRSWLLFTLLVTMGVMILVSGCTTTGNTPEVTVSPTPVGSPVVTTIPVSSQSCTVYDDCVPAECCHPTSCINKAEKRVCTVMCTMSCEGPIDCGAGQCGCVNGKCDVIPSTSPK
jgi:hypothetical protein